MKNKNGFFEKLLFNNKLLFVFSIVLAIIFWAAVKINFSDNTTKTVSDVKVSIDNSLAEVNDFVPFIDDENLLVDVEVSGKSYAINAYSFTKDSITVEAVSGYIDAAGYKVLTLSAKVSESDVSVVSIYPSTITVFYDRKATDTFNVEAKLNNDPDTLVSDGYSAGLPVPSLSTVDVSGPATVVEKIKKVYFEATLDEENLPLTATREVTADVSFDLENDRGVQFLVCDSLADKANTPTVTVPVSRVKTVPTSVKFINEPSYYEENMPIVKISPSQVEISFNPQDETDYESFSVGTIDFRNLKNGINTFEFTLDEKSVVNLVDTTIEKFTVTVNMNSKSAVDIDARTGKVVMLNQSDGYSYEADIDTGGLDSVTLIGPKSSLESITADKLQIEINVSSLDLTKTSWQTVDVSNISIQTAEGEQCWVYGNYTARIKVTKK